MRSLSRTVAVLLLASPAFGLANPSQKPGAPAPKAATPAPADVSLHALGVESAQNVRLLQLSPSELELVKRGFAEALASPKPLPPPADQAGVDAFLRGKLAAATAANKAAGKAFADKAAAEKGAQKTASGLVYTSVQEGSGASPKPSDVVKVSVRGTLTDGTIFDPEGDTAEFPMSRALPCVSEGLAKMKPGGKARLVCPPNTAFGDQGRAPSIPPGATLVFDVALISAQAAPAGVPGHGGSGMPAGHPPMGTAPPKEPAKPKPAAKK